jgi:predicted enzyme related to lactoylglutathione lyase
MSDKKNPTFGMIAWVDLTVPNAEETKNFYEDVIGWKAEPVSMGDYNDFNMTSPETGEPVTGVCHARGVNEDLPPNCLVYITVADLADSVSKVETNGGKLIKPFTSMGEYGSYAVIEDPAGAVCALFEQKNN